MENNEQVQRDIPAKSKNYLVELYGMLHDLIYILAAVTLVFVFVVRLVGVDGESMLPTLKDKDFLLLQSNFLYGEDDIENGDIVVLNVPYFWERDEALIVKRVIATEGQTVDIDFTTGHVYVDNKQLDEEYILELTQLSHIACEMQFPATVPEGCIFVLGDNRNNSTDSRFAPVGMIDKRCVLGKVWAIALPGREIVPGEENASRDWSRIGLVS